MLGGIFILTALIVLPIIAIYLVHRKDYDEFLQGLTVVLGIVCILTGLCMLVAIPFSRNIDRRNLQDFEETRQTIRNLRTDNTSGLERVQLADTIIEKNNWLKSLQYDNHHYWDLWTVDEVDLVKPIR